MMVSDEMGDIPAGNTSGLGLYFSDTRFLSAYAFRLNRLKPILLSASVDESYVATFQMVNPVLLLDEGKRRIPQQSLSIRRSRFIYGGLHERIGIQNCGSDPVDIECSLRISADFRDMFDIRGYKLQTLGQLRMVEAGNPGMTFTYDGQDGLIRRTEVVVNRPPTSQDGETMTWHFPLTSKQTITLVIDIIPLIGEGEPMLSYLYDDALQALQASYRRWHDQTTRISTDNAFLDRGLLRRGQMDLLNDQHLFVELLPALMNALTWVDRYGDGDHDGFVEYAERASGGVRNQGWKDSSDSLLYPDGRPAELPAALVEVQGYVYQAKVGLSRILERLGQSAMAEQIGRASCRERVEGVG